MKSRKFYNGVLYLVAAIFLAYHLLPVGSAVAKLKPTEPSRDQLASAALCEKPQSELMVPTFGNPLTEPLMVDLAARKQLVDTVKPQASIYDQEQVASVADWESSRYGNNDGRTSLLNQQSARETVFRVDIERLNDGDTKWLSPAFETSPGQNISATFSYRGNRDIKPTVAFINSDGDTKYVSQRVVTATQAWQTARVDFVVPPQTQKIRFTVNLDDSGWLETKSYAINSLTLPQLQRGIATFTFDDGWKTIHDQGLPLFRKYDIQTTQFVVANYEGSPAYMSQSMIDDFRQAGHDLGSHSFSHANLTTLGADGLRQEVAGSQAVLHKEFGGMNNFAAPFGVYNDAVQAQIRQCYQSHRTTDTGYNAAGYDRYQIKVQNVEVDTKPEEIRAWADFARENKLWLVLVYHQVESGGEYSVDTKVLESHLQAVKSSGIHTATFEQALLETYPQGR